VTGLVAGCDAVRDVIEAPVIDTPPRNVVLQGSITGLGSQRPVVLQYNGQDTCVDTRTVPETTGVPCRFFGIPGQLTSTFSFGSLPEGTPYNITVKANPFGKICTVSNAQGVLGQGAPPPAVTCVNDPAVPRYSVTVHIAPAVSSNPTARVRLATEEGVLERSAHNATQIVFPDVLFDSGTNLPIFKWFVTATSASGTTTNNCQVLNGTNERLDADGQDITTPPTGPADDVQVTQCSFTVSATVAYQAASGQPVLPMPPGGMELGLRRARTGEIERRVELQQFSTVSFADVMSNADAIYELAVTRQPEGMHCVVGSASQYQWGSAVLLLDPLDANRTVNHGWIIQRNVRCRAVPEPAARLKGAFRIHTQSSTGETTATRNFLTFFDDGTYLYMHHAIGTLCSRPCGVEHGFYMHDPVARTISFAPVTDTNGASGLSSTTAGIAIATPLTEVQRWPGPGARIEAKFGNTAWRLEEPPSVDGEMAGAWATFDHRRVWIFDASTYNGVHAGVNGLGNAQVGCFNIEDVHAPVGTYTRRGNATTCALGTGYFTLDVPNADTVPRAPDGFVGKWPQATSNADGRPSSPVNYVITPGSPDQLRIRETVNGSETLDGITPVSPEILLYRLRAD
jgi:hypothetical protein